MKGLSTLLELARNGKQSKVSLHDETTARARARVRGAILGARSTKERAVEEVENFSRQEEAILNALLEHATGDLAFPIDRLCKEIFSGDTRRLTGVLQRIQEEGLIAVATANGEPGAKLTLKGAVFALYGDWLLEERGNPEKDSLLQIPAIRHA